MSVTITLLAGSLTASLRENDKARTDTLLERALVEPYAFEGGDPAGLILHAGKESGDKTLLRGLAAEKITDLSLDGMLAQDRESRKQAFMRANTLFDLARDLFLEHRVTKQGKGVLAILEAVWKDQAAWRRAAGETFQEKESLFAWVDPATTAEESLLKLTTTQSPLAVKQQIMAIDKLSTEHYPAPMADYAFHSHLIHAVKQYQRRQGQAWAQTAGFILGRRAAFWYQYNRLLLEHTLAHALLIVRDQEKLKERLAEHIESGSLTQLNRAEWNEVKKFCPGLQQVAKPSPADPRMLVKNSTGYCLNPDVLAVGRL